MGGYECVRGRGSGRVSEVVGERRGGAEVRELKGGKGERLGERANKKLGK